MTDFILLFLPPSLAGQFGRVIGYIEPLPELDEEEGGSSAGEADVELRKCKRLPSHLSLTCRYSIFFQVVRASRVPVSDP